MVNDQTDAPFDTYVENYSVALNAGLSLSGENQKFFAEQRIRWFAKQLYRLGHRARHILDFGAGQGSSTPLLLELLKGLTATGVDVSGALMTAARDRNTDRRLTYLRINSASRGEPRFDCAYTNGVFHHIPANQRPNACRYILDSLTPGGLLALWENNPWNPGTRYAMSRIPFDADAETLTIGEAVEIARAVGFDVIRVDSLFFFPRAFRALRWLEPRLSWTRLGAQYMVLCRKPGPFG